MAASPGWGRGGRGGGAGGRGPAQLTSVVNKPSLLFLSFLPPGLACFFPPSLFPPPILTDCNAEEAPPLISIEGGEDGGLEDGWRIGGGGGEGLFF